MITGAFLQATTRNFLKLNFGLGNIATKLQTQLQDLTKQNNLCTEQKAKLALKIRKIVAQLKSLVKVLQSILSILKKILHVTRLAQKVLIGLLILVKVLKFLPIPARFTTVGRINRLGSTLSKLEFRIKAALIIITGLGLVVGFVSSSLSGTIAKIRSIISGFRVIGDQLKGCHGDLSDELGTTLDETEVGIENLESQLGSLANDSSSYKGFTFSIIEEQTTSEVVAKRRYAIATNSNGILTLEGPLSYATDTKTLIDELKLRIDNENLVGYPIDPNQSETEEDILTPELEAEDMGYDLEEIEEDQKEADDLVSKMEAQDLSEIAEAAKKAEEAKKSKFVKMLEKKQNKNKFAKLLLKRINKKEITEKKAKQLWALNIFRTL